MFETAMTPLLGYTLKVLLLGIKESRMRITSDCDVALFPLLEKVDELLSTEVDALYLVQLSSLNSRSGRVSVIPGVWRWLEHTW